MDVATGGTRRRQRPLHSGVGVAVDQRPDQIAVVSRIADRDACVDRSQLRHKIIVDAVMDQQAPERRAALSRGPHRTERHRPECQVEIGRRRDDRSVVPAEL